MSSLPLATTVYAPRVRKSLLSVAMLLCATSSLCLAQETGRMAAPVSLQAAKLQNMQATGTKAAAAMIVGTWGNSRSDKETGEEETSIIEFKPDGSYTTRIRNSQFPDMEKMPLAGGSYALTAADKGGFTVVLDRTRGDPEEDKATARSTMVVSIVDEKTLRAPDGALLSRIK
ncbi:MAG: hypothetical protein ABI858_00500 [Pseudoxanthomonas sp.]